MRTFLLIIVCIFYTHALFGQKKKVKAENQQGRSGFYKIKHDDPQQYIWGLGFEIQSDAIASANAGLPTEPTSVPHDLVPSERDRLYAEMLKGFRYCRIAGGLYLRGTTPDKKEIRGRWNSQMLELNEMISKSGVEGVSFEYWSPMPFWKANGKFEGADGSENKLKCFGKNFINDPVYKGDTIQFLRDFAESLVSDIQYLEQNGLKVDTWGLQNEPPGDAPYSSCKYTEEEYYIAFKNIAPYIKAYKPSISIIADTWFQNFSRRIKRDSIAVQYVDAWVWHQIGDNSDNVIKKRDEYLHDTFGKPVYQNEYEYLEGGTSPERCLNTVQNMMNWFTFVNSPTWYWIHALKPTYNEEANGYSLGFWRPWDDEKTTDIEKGHWKYNANNFNALAGFLKYMPWNSRRYSVSEDSIRNDNRIFAFKTPGGKNVIVITNRSGHDFTFNIDLGTSSKYVRHRYTPSNAGHQNKGIEMGSIEGANAKITLPHLSWEFVVEQ